MATVAIMTDSNSGITQEQGRALGIFVVPMPFMIDNEEFFEDINLTNTEFFEKLKTDANISTSQPTPGSVMSMWDEALKSYDEVVYIPMSSGLSSSCNTAAMLAQDDPYDGKVYVIDNQRISVTQRRSVLDALDLANQGMNGSQIKQVLLDMKFESSIYIMLDTLKYLLKGGRITPAAAMLGTVLRLKPVLQIQGEKLDAFAKAKTVKQAKSIMIKAIRKDMEKRFGGANKDNMWLCVAHTQNEDEAHLLKEELEKKFPGFEIYVDHLSLSVSCHIGPGALAVACSKKLK